MSKEKNKFDIIYALADYKQLVLAYKSKHAELIKRVVFWKVSFFWLALVTMCLGVGLYLALIDKKNDIACHSNTIARLNNRIEAVSETLEKTQGELRSTKEELANKQNVITQLEQNVSNASKKLLEKLLIEQQEAHK